MNAFKNLFASSKADPPIDLYGRYNERYHIEQQDDTLVEAETNFRNGNRLKAYRLALQPILTGDTVEILDSVDKLKLDIEQGSTHIHATITHETIQAYAKIIVLSKDIPDLAYDLLQRNDSFEYISFTQQDQHILLEFDALSSLCSPMQLLDALRELAIISDKSDDFLLDEYPDVVRYQEHSLHLIPEERQVQFSAFAQEELTSALHQARQYEEQHEFGLAARRILGSCYLIDYITSPHGASQEAIEAMHRQFFDRNAESIRIKLSALKRAADTLLDDHIPTISEEFHDVKHTFGITKAIHRKKISAIVFQEMDEMTWYLREKQSERFHANAAYIVGYCLFHYAPPLEDRILLHLLVQLLRPKIFQKLGYNTYIKPNGKLKKAAFRATCNSISQQYPDLWDFSDQLDRSSLNQAIRSVLTYLVNRA